MINKTAPQSAFPRVRQSAFHIDRALLASWDMHLIFLTAAILLLFITLDQGNQILSPVRVVLGLIHALYVPGYCLTAVLFPRRNDLDMVIRTAMSIGTSLALLPVLAMLLDKLGLGIRLWPMVGALTLWMFVLSAIGMIRRLSLARSGMAYLPPTISAPMRRRVAAGTMFFLGMAVLIAYFIVIPARTLNVTEFYILSEHNNEKVIENYPVYANVYDELSVTMGVVNRENIQHTYHVEIWVFDSQSREYREMVRSIEPFTLEPGMQREWPVSWHMPWAGKDQQVEFLLYTANKPQPYRQLHLWVNVTDYQRFTP